ncbi:MAG: arylsulfatase [Segetibacter sp.]|nr:arylsulfatase [Segetibacter sp.]
MKITRINILAVLCLLIIQAHAQQKPNIIIILADDLGFSDIGAYGGEVNTPNIDQLAKEGIRYKQFYNAARCCPTRASLMTGLYPHQAGMGWMAAANLGTPAYQDDLNRECVTIAEVLKTAGYGTYMTGKWHLTNERKIDGEVTDSWPKQRGFDRYFGIVPGGANYFTPVIYSDNTSYKAPENFYLTHAITDSSVKFINNHFANNKAKPMFMYVAYTSPHWPLHALQKDIDKYKDKYKIGWDKLRQQRFERQKQIGLFASNVELSPRDSVVPAWNNLPVEKQNEFAMRMAIYAAQIDAMDQGIGKIIAKLKEKNQLDNTLIFFLSDNGACAEFINSGKSKAVDGTEDTWESYRINWANASSTPFQQYKHYTHEGGIASPLIVHWPAIISKNLNNKFVNEYGHVSDIMATCVDVAKATYPAKFAGHTITPLQGKSLLPHFTGKTNNRGIIYWEHEANIAMRDGKWKLVAKTHENNQLDKKNLELYDMDTDPSEQHDLTSKHPDRVNTMFNSWMKWAKSIGAFPLDTREYGVRIQAYRGKINGGFDDNLGGWNVKKSPDVEAEVEIDTTGKLTGKKSVHISIVKPGDKPAGLVLNWPFKASKGEAFKVALNARANTNTSFWLRLEKANGNFEKVIDQEIKVSQKPGKSSYQSIQIPADDMYRVALYFGKLAAGDEVWVDDVELIPVGNSKVKSQK